MTDNEQSELFLAILVSFPDVCIGFAGIAVDAYMRSGCDYDESIRLLHKAKADMRQQFSQLQGKMYPYVSFLLGIRPRKINGLIDDSEEK